MRRERGFGGDEGSEFTYRADFRFTARNGATITGEAIGSIASFEGPTLNPTLIVENATKQFKRLRGGEFFLVSNDFQPGSGTLRGTLTTA